MPVPGYYCSDLRSVNSLITRVNFGPGFQTRDSQINDPLPEFFNHRIDLSHPNLGED